MRDSDFTTKDRIINLHPKNSKNRTALVDEI